jgi:N-glycosylase/DNA lyase
MKRSTLRAEAVPGKADVKNDLREHLRAQDDVSKIQRALGEDKVIARGLRSMRGLRIVKIDEWEALASFVLATYANIPRIIKMIDAISREYGREIVEGVFSFPTRSELSNAKVSDLARLGLGYRAKYLHELCRAVDEDKLRHLKRLGYEELREKLKVLPGVGDKVADCVSLFGFGKLEAFPIDVWMERALSRLYGQKGSYSKLREFAASRFGLYAGYAQEYIYLNERAYASAGACRFTSGR